MRDRPFSHGYQINLVRDISNNFIKDKNGDYELRISYYVRAPKYRVIVFKGGGGRTWVYKKFLHILEEKGLSDGIKEVGGSSAGALFAVLAAMPLPPDERNIVKEDTQEFKDILSDSTWSTVYRIFTFPLYFINKPLDWIARITNWVGNKCNQYLLGNIIGWPLKIISAIFKTVAFLTHPDLAAGIYNIVTKGGMYRGEKLQSYLRDSIYDKTKQCLEEYLNKITDPVKKDKAIIRLAMIPKFIYSIQNDPQTQKIKIELTKEITFNHFYRLSKIKDCGFKEIFLTATRCRESDAGRLKVFNHKSDPNKSIYKVIRMSMAAPYIYQRVEDDGVEYMDGGCADNFPIQYASTRNCANNFEKSYYRGKDNQDLDIFGVRVEYERDLGILHYPIKTLETWWERFTDRIERWVYNTLCGMDIYATEDSVQRAVKEKYPLRVLQLYDHGVGFTEFDVSKERQKPILDCEEKRINEFLRVHTNQLTHLETYDSLCYKGRSKENVMPLKKQKKLLEFLKKEYVTDDDVFSDHLSLIPYEKVRQQLINTLTKNIRREPPSVLVTESKSRNKNTGFIISAITQNPINIEQAHAIPITTSPKPVDKPRKFFPLKPIISQSDELMELKMPLLAN